jgi:hypothetical protein
MASVVRIRMNTGTGFINASECFVTLPEHMARLLTKQQREGEEEDIYCDHIRDCDHTSDCYSESDSDQE